MKILLSGGSRDGEIVDVQETVYNKGFVQLVQRRWDPIPPIWESDSALGAPLQIEIYVRSNEFGMRKSSKFIEERCPIFEIQK